MTESSGITGEYRWLTTNTNLLLVADNLYMRSLGNSDIPFDTRLITFDNQNSKTKQPDTRLSTFGNQNSKERNLISPLGVLFNNES